MRWATKSRPRPLRRTLQPCTHSCRWLIHFSHIHITIFTSAEIIKHSNHTYCNSFLSRQDVDQRLREESSKVEVAVRFVEWFTSRGAGYEHNLRAIDRHLQQLAPTPDAARQQLGHGVAMLRTQRDLQRDADS